MSRALRAFGQDSITDQSGKSHDWRRELAERLLALQEPDGSWVNRNSDRWLEGEACLATAYAVLALEEVIRSTDSVEVVEDCVTKTGDSVKDSPGD